MKRGVILAAGAALIGSVFLGQAPPPPPTLFAVACADITGAIECGAQMQAAEDACAAAGGGTVVYPAGVLLNRTGVIVRSPCRYTGQGWQLWNGNGSQPGYGTQGTYIRQSLVLGAPPANSAFTLTATAHGAVIERMAFVQEHAPDAVGWTPKAYPASIRTDPTASAGGFVLRELMFWGVDRAIVLGSIGTAPNGAHAGSGLITIHSSLFDCFTLCIDTAFAGDFNHFYDLKFSSHLVAAGNPNQVAYTRTHAIGIKTARADDPAYANISMFGQRIGFLFSSNVAGNTGKSRISGYDCDGCWAGIYVNGAGSSLQVSNFSFRGYDPDSTNVGVHCTAACEIDGANWRLENVGIAGILAGAETGTADIAVTNLRIFNCNQLGGWAALSAGSGSIITVGGRWAFGGGSCTTEKSGDVRTSHAN